VFQNLADNTSLCSPADEYNMIDVEDLPLSIREGRKAGVQMST